jgi:hypothetical protein
MENFEYAPQRVREREPNIPTIKVDEQRFIENTGGEYAGYVRAEDGRKTYEEFRIDRRARYDEDRRTVVEIYIATEIVDSEGEKEMLSPKDAFGFSVMISLFSQSGEELARPEILTVRPIDFENKRMVTADLRNLACKVHALARDASSSSRQSDLSGTVKRYLQSEGWNPNR